jgi:HEPN domain-containing protein
LSVGEPCCKKDIARKIKKELHYLYENYRKLADYRLELPIGKTIAERAVSKAEEIFKLIENC